MHVSLHVLVSAMCASRRACRAAASASGLVGQGSRYRQPLQVAPLVIQTPLVLVACAISRGANNLHRRLFVLHGACGIIGLD
jgi:hypothetical protein